MRWFGPGLALALVLVAARATGDVPYPTCADAGCADPGDFASYLFLAPGQLPNDATPGSGDYWKFAPENGMDILGAWQITTGRPDVVVAVLDSGIRWNDRSIATNVWLNVGELPLPDGCGSYDCNGDGFVSVLDWGLVPDGNGNGFPDGQDFILFFSDGADDDGNGFVDDIAGWDFFENDNDPFDDVDYGHGTGEAKDQVSEANDGGGFPGVAPSAFHLPLRVGDSFVAFDQDFAQAVVYAVDQGVDVVSEALGTLNASDTGQGAVDYAYSNRIPIIASAADEESRHHNYPANYDHTIWVNSIVHGDGTFVTEGLAEGVADLLNGCTNFGARAWVAISSNSCSSEATGRTGGMTLLLRSHEKNLGIDPPLSAEEIRQLYRQSAEDIDHTGEDPSLTPSLPILEILLSSIPAGLEFGSSRFPTRPGWDQYTGYGRPDAVALLEALEDGIPPEADLTGSLDWFEVIDPTATPWIPVVGTAAARRSAGDFSYEVSVGCGIEPDVYDVIGAGVGNGAMENAILATWDTATTAATCGFDATSLAQPDDRSVTLLLEVIDDQGRHGEDRRLVSLHTDPTLHFTREFEGSADGPLLLFDLDRDGALDILHGTGDGTIHAWNGRHGTPLPGFPVKTNPIPVHPSPAWGGSVPTPHEGILGGLALGDLDLDGRPEIVAASLEGRVYAFDDHGIPLPGFPVSSDPALSAIADRDRFNDTDPGFLAAPTLADLDAPGGDPGLEIVVPGFDGHLYAWRSDGTPVPGFPVLLADPDRVATDPATGKRTPLPGVDAQERLAKSLGSAAIGDLDGDGTPEIVVPTNEEYGNEPDGFAVESNLLGALLGIGFDELEFDTRGRVYAVHADGNLHAGGPFVPGWPVSTPLATAGLLPTVGTGTPGAAALADLHGQGTLTVAIFGTIGPVMLFDANGDPALGEIGGRPRALAHDFPLGFPFVPGPVGDPGAPGSGDAPFFGSLGAGAFGDITGDGLPEYVAPTGGLRKLIDIAAPANQGFGDHQVTAWNPLDGTVLPAFPRPMDDMMFLTSPSLADVDGDGQAEVVQGSGAYLVRAYRSDGTVPEGWPKFTHGWITGTPAAGDVDGDGLIEVAVATREGRLFVWNTPAPVSDAALPWPAFGRDPHRTQNLASGISPLGDPGDPLSALLWSLEGVRLDAAARIGALDAAIGVLESGGIPKAELWQKIEAALAGEPALRDRMALDVGAAARRLADAPSCNPAKPACTARRVLADMLARVAHIQYWVLGSPNTAVYSWGQAIQIAGG